ncbi:MAG: nucleoside triphosphate pyrophosphohydrolase [Rhodospirillaceae bacterium]|nr:nucleoside triphosphate pyrophosphohydrolase [Rhodospirillaceae bacterium]MBT5374120.1 nucleoside triphosphate pyrophosphohydrolase [Rhodospirillaceae bacterium]MBT5659066.1 nucleoside triphosphate pyrophosphohydrolase [Rhodospirillaceae bacterium]
MTNQKPPSSPASNNASSPASGSSSGVSSSIDRLIEVMARLRDPETGCPWDKEQSFRTIAPYTIEESYEVAEAIEEGDHKALKEELGDLLFQVVFYAQMGREEGLFDFNDITQAITDKMIRRHPHVFADTSHADIEAQTHAWEAQKAAERREKMELKGQEPSLLDDVPAALPALIRAEKLQKRAARVGFDWPNPSQVLDKIEEEIAELRVEIGKTGTIDRQEDELGDLVFALSNLARHLKIDPESALRRTNAKFERRFRRIESLLKEQGRIPVEADLAEMEALWNQAKDEERA